MKMTTKGRYAVTAILDVALHDSNGPVNLSDISRRQDISLTYLEQLFSKLKKNGLVESARGPVAVIVWRKMLTKLPLPKLSILLMNRLMLRGAKVSKTARATCVV